MTDKTEDPVVTFENDFDVPDFDETIADPAIRADFREALGRFIMAHNEVDFWMTGILSKAVKMLALGGSLANLALGDFAMRATDLALLMHTAQGAVFIG